MMAKRFPGGYEIVAELGVGAVGQTFEAVCKKGPLIGQHVCLKVLSEAVGEERRKAALRSLRHEAAIVGELSHPNIAGLLDVGTDEEGIAFIVFELVRGPNLVELLRYLRPKGLSPGQVAHVGLQIAGALAHAHERNVLHRDVKGRNILISQEGDATLVDFGVAKVGAYADEATHGVGSRDYFSPEQVRGAPLTPASDVFSLGIVLFQLLTGQHPFWDEDEAVFSRNILEGRLRCDLGGLPHVPQDLVAIVTSCLSPDPDRRFQTGQALERALTGAVVGNPDRVSLGELAAKVRRARLEPHEDSFFDDDGSEASGPSSHPSAVMASLAERVAHIRDETEDFPTNPLSAENRAPTRPADPTLDDSLPTRVAPTALSRSDDRKPTRAADPQMLAIEAAQALPEGPGQETQLGDLHRIANTPPGLEAPHDRRPTKHEMPSGRTSDRPPPGPEPAPPQTPRRRKVLRGFSEPGEEPTAPPPQKGRGRALWAAAAILLIAGGAAALWHGKAPDPATAATSATVTETETVTVPVADTATETVTDTGTDAVTATDTVTDTVADTVTDTVTAPATTTVPAKRPKPKRRAAPTHELSVGLVPRGTLFIDGKKVGTSQGTAPVKTTLPAGTYEAVAVHDGNRRRLILDMPDHPHSFVIDLRDGL